MKAIVVGAGLAGLSAGYKLKQAGWQVTVLESGNYVGGRTKSVNEKGYCLDLAATQMTSGYKDYLALCREFHIDHDLVASSPVAAFLKNGKLIEIDSSKFFSAALSPLLSLGSKFTLLKTLWDKRTFKPPVDYLDISASHACDDESLEDYCLRRLNRELFDYLVVPVMKGNFLQNPGKVTKLEWFAFLGGFASHTLLAMTGGAGRLPKCLAEELDIKLDAPVTRVQQEADGVRVAWQENGQTQKSTTDACVIATRFPEAIKICQVLGKAGEAFNQKLRYCRTVVVHLGYTKKTNSKALGVFVPDKENERIALVWLDHNKLPGSVPEGHSLISCYLSDTTNENCYEMDDEKLIDISADFVEKHFPELLGNRNLTRVSRWAMAIPIPEPGTHTALYHMKQQHPTNSPIQFAGDYFTCTGQNSAVHYGNKAAQTLLDSFPVAF